MSATLNPNHSDDTGASDLSDWFSDWPDTLTRVEVCIAPDPDNVNVVFLEVRSERWTRRMTASYQESGADVRLSRDGLRQMRALIDRALGDRT